MIVTSPRCPHRPCSCLLQPSFDAHIKAAEFDTSGRYARTAFAGAFAGGEYSHIRMSVTAFVHMARDASTKEVDARIAAWWSFAAANRSTLRTSPARERIAAGLVIAPLTPGAVGCHTVQQDDGSQTGDVWVGVGAAPTTALSVPLPELTGVRPYLRHCVSDSANLRDIVKVRIANVFLFSLGVS